MNARWVGAGAALGGAALATAAVLAARLASLQVPWQVALPAGAAAGLLVALAAWFPGADPAELTPPVSRAAVPIATAADLGALHFAVEGAGRDPDRFEQRIRPRLGALATELLWQRHGLDWRDPADREAARAVLGPHAWALLTAPRHSLRLTPDALSRWVDELENL